MEEENRPNIPRLCRKKCGFFGSPNFDGLCSKCHRDAQAQVDIQQSDRKSPVLESRLSSAEIRKSPEPSAIQSKADSPSPASERNSLSATPSPPPAVSVESSPSTQPSIPDSQTDTEVANAGLSDLLLDEAKSDSNRSSPASNKPLRCDFCRKRVGLVGGYPCRCGKTFCSAHRYSDTHDCSYNYREAGQEDIRRANPQVVCSKLTKI